jgi:type IV pilus assembly protein PilX
VTALARIAGMQRAPRRSSSAAMARAPGRSPGAAGPARQRGLVLITSLLLLVVVTILAVGMFRSFGIQEQIAGNVRDKQRAISVAETAEQYAESYLSSGNAASATACTTQVTYATPQVCSLTLQAQGVNPASVPWLISGAKVGVTYAPAGPVALPVNATSQQTLGGFNTYSQTPVFYIGFLSTGTANGMITNIYQIDAVAYGGSANTTAVVEATYQTQTSTKNLGETQ